MMRILFFFIVFGSFPLYLAQAQKCPYESPHYLNRFGPSCEYMCHCGRSKCNKETGECPDNVECDAGWMGRGCQYINIAFKALVETVHLTNRQHITDGDKSTCSFPASLSMNIANLTVDLRLEMKITEVHLLFAKSAHPFNVSILGKNETNLCGSVNDTSGKKEFIVKCGRPLYGQRINISSVGPDAGLALCDLQVPAGRNLAYGKPAYQSSLVESYYASRAVDGVAVSSMPEDTCTHTKDSTDPWWLLDLQALVMIQWLRIYNRKDDSIDKTLNERLKNFRILLSKDNVTFDRYYQDPTDIPELVINSVLRPDVAAGFVKIDLQGEDRILTLCEVQVFGDCTDGRYGDCNKTCDRCLDKKCDKLTGYCEECRHGYYGNQCNISCDYCMGGDCKINTGICVSCPPGKHGNFCKENCPDHFYGSNCLKRCGSCLDGDPCDKVTGDCPRGCKSGWKEGNCHNECDDYLYGNCSTHCGQCADGKPCNKSSGICDKGSCAPGWQSDKCDIPCNDNFYGNCTTRCGNCSDSAVCDKVNGSCPSGLCSDGWSGEKCNTMCNSTYYGKNCARRCGHCRNGTCDRLTGECPMGSGCLRDWHGSRCDISSKMIQNPDDSGTSVSVIAGSVAAVVAIVALILVVVIIVRMKVRRAKTRNNAKKVLARRKAERSSLKLPGARDQPSTKEDGVEYENSTFAVTSNSLMKQNEEGNEVNENKTTAIQLQQKRVAVSVKEDVEIYYNFGHKLPKGTIQLSKFWDYVQEKILDDKHFSEEFEQFPSGPQFPTTVALRPENRNKNRYKDLYAYDVNRVVLNPMGDDDNDYINASFVDGYSQEKMYIASQGTTKHNIYDFWRMVWQHDVEKIVMLTGLVECGKHKCELYWPEVEGETCTFGSMAVTLLDTDLFADYEIRKFEISVGKKSQQLTHFHYTAWPDKGVPRTSSSIVQLWNRVNRVPTIHPIIVHCSAGVGRTGTYIALDYLVNQGKAEGQVNVAECVSKLRRERVNMVQTKEQYIFLHEALVEALMLSGTATTSDKFPNVYQDLLEVVGESGKLKLQLEYERLQDEVANHETVFATIQCDDEEEGEGVSKIYECAAAKKPENRTKNRYDNVLPAEGHRVFLSTTAMFRNDYINAVVLPNHRRRDGFILTQMPLSDTVTDFWRMINDFQIRSIVMLNCESSSSHDIGVYWPNEGEVQYGPYSVGLKAQEKCKNYIERTLYFSFTGDKHERYVKQFQFTNWADNADVPGTCASFLELFDAVESWHNEGKPIVVHCLNGAERSGLYCVMSTVIERLKVDRDVAIAQTIKKMRAIRQQVIPNYEQFKFCHECILQYMKTFETYSNC